ncbi:MAG: hypothetical protein IPM32_08955 [Ignavibacteriae bacterium]|nr:hypothetical protein [Ignavibacteriota bacterium]
MPVRDFLKSDEDPQEGFGAYGYLLFTHRPIDSEKERYSIICNSFFSEIIDMNEYSEYDISKFMVTFWLIKDSKDLTSKNNNCEEYISNYDFARAQVIASSINRNSVEGPILVAWTLPFLLNNNKSAQLILDMSNFSNEDISRAFRIWKDRITQNPEVWNDGFVMQIIVEEFRSLIQKYGQTFINIFN